LYFEARYYDQLNGRFISPDPLFGEQMDKCLSSVIECNLYQYTKNNPLIYLDPDGEESIPYNNIWQLPTWGGDVAAIKLTANSIGEGAKATTDTAVTVSGYTKYVPIPLISAPSAALDSSAGAIEVAARIKDSDYDLGEMSRILTEEAVGRAVGNKLKGIKALVKGGSPDKEFADMNLEEKLMKSGTDFAIDEASGATKNEIQEAMNEK